MNIIQEIFKTWFWQISGLILISITPLLIYITYKTPEDDGKKLGTVGWLLTKILRRLK